MVSAAGSKGGRKELSKKGLRAKRKVTKPKELEGKSEDEIYELAMEAQGVRDIPNKTGRYLNMAQRIATSPLSHGIEERTGDGRNGTRKRYLVGKASFGDFNYDTGTRHHCWEEEVWPGSYNEYSGPVLSKETLEYKNRIVASRDLVSGKYILNETDEWTGLLKKLFEMAVKL